MLLALMFSLATVSLATGFFIGKLINRVNHIYSILEKHEDVQAELLDQGKHLKGMIGRNASDICNLEKDVQHIRHRVKYWKQS